jgi:hypothetical protein
MPIAYQPINPISLEGSMTEASSAQSSLDALLKQLTEQSAAQQAAAAAAGQNLQTASAAPVPTVDPLSSGIEKLFGNLASAVSQNPTYGTQAQESVATQNANLAQRRLDHLKTMESQYTQMAEAARQSGNALQEMKMNEAINKVHTAQEKVLKLQQENSENSRVNAVQAAENNRTEYRGKIDLGVALINAKNRLSASLKEGFDEAGFMKPDFYVVQQNKLKAASNNPKMDKDKIRSDQLENNAFRLTTEKSPKQMLQRLLGLRDPADANKYLLSGQPIRSRGTLGMEGPKGAPIPANEQATARIAADQLNHWFSEAELEAFMASPAGKRYFPDASYQSPATAVQAPRGK